MRNIIEIGADGNPITPELVIATRDGTKIGVINNVSGLVYSANMNSPDEISFTVNKMIDGKECLLWNDVKDLRLVYVPQYNEWFEISVAISEDNETVKSVNGYHAQEAELSQRLLFETEINTEDDIAREDYVVTKFYNPEIPKGSLLHRILADKGQDYSFYHVDRSLWDVQRTFTFNGKSIKDSLDEIGDEVQCLFVYGLSADDDGKIHRTISAYDLLDHCAICGERGDFTDGICPECGSDSVIFGYGEDTNIFINKENIASSISLNSNVDQVKNCFRLEAGDDVMNAVVRSISPSSSQYLWYFSDDMKNDMSEELRNKYNEYEELMSAYSSTVPMDMIPEDLVNKYNILYLQYRRYNPDLGEVTYPILGTTALIDADYKFRAMYDYLNTTMMPGSPDTQDTTAQEQVDKLNQAYSGGDFATIGLGPDKNLDTVSVYTADSAVLGYAKIYVDTARYRVQISNSSYENHVWQGVLIVTSYTDDEDTAYTPPLSITLNTADATYIQQQINKTIDKVESQNLGCIELFKMSENRFTEAIRLYSLANLEIIRDVCTACINILIEQGVANDQEDLYENVYLPYYNKSGIIEEELKLRGGILADLLAPNEDADYGLIDYVEKQREANRKALDIYTYLGEDLWQELMTFRRDTTLSNKNYISDGLNDNELIDNAIQFYKWASKEALKSTTLQNTLQGKLQDFLIMPEFKGLLDKAKLGNKIHLEINDTVYKLRLISCQVSYEKLKDIDIDFSDVVKAGDILSDTRSILDQARSIASSYSATARQANRGSRANELLNNFVMNGLDLTAKKIVNTADNQNMVIDESGMYLRRHLDFEDGYMPEQTRVINSGIYITTDAFRTVKTAIGRFQYIDPETGDELSAYGVNGETVIGKLILGHNLGIYNSSASLKFNYDGLTVTNGVNTVIINPNADSIFTILNGDDDVISFDDGGNAMFDGKLYSTEGTIGGYNITQYNLYSQHTNRKTEIRTEPVTDAYGNPIYTEELAYDDNGDPVYETDENDNIIYDTELAYDDNGSPIYETDANDNIIYDTVPVLDENGNQMYDYDDNGNPVPVTQQQPRQATILVPRQATVLVPLTREVEVTVDTPEDNYTILSSIGSISLGVGATEYTLGGDLPDIESSKIKLFNDGHIHSGNITIQQNADSSIIYMERTYHPDSETNEQYGARFHVTGSGSPAIGISCKFPGDSNYSDALMYIGHNGIHPSAYVDGMSLGLSSARWKCVYTNGLDVTYDSNCILPYRIKMRDSSGKQRQVIELWGDETTTSKYGANMVIGSSGNMFIGSGESAFEEHKVHGDTYTEQLFISSDEHMYFIVGCQNMANRKSLILSTNLNLYTNGLTGIGNLGTSANRWRTAWLTYNPNVSSDERLKKDFAEIYNAKQLIMNINPVQFRYKAEENGRLHYGFSAQQFVSAMKKSDIDDCGVWTCDVTEDGAKQGYTRETAPEEYKTYGMRYEELIAPMVQVLHEFEDRISKLEQELKEKNG